MIRKFRLDDLDKIMRIWIEANVSTHYFIDESYWKENFEMVKEMMPKSNLYVYEVDGIILGFIGILDSYIAGIFVKEAYRSNGIGKKLLDYSKNKNKKLTLSVYKNNTRAIDFYINEKFSIVGESLDDINNQKELNMEWKNILI